MNHPQFNKDEAMQMSPSQQLSPLLHQPPDVLQQQILQSPSQAPTCPDQDLIPGQSPLPEGNSSTDTPEPKAKPKRQRPIEHPSSPKSTTSNDSISENDQLEYHLPSAQCINQKTVSEDKLSDEANRNWRLIRYDHHQNVDPNLTVNINLSIRGEDAKCFVPDRLYCSHRYKVQHSIVSSQLPRSVPLLLSVIRVIDPSSKEEILSKKTGKPIIKGDSEAACTLSDEGFECKMRIQFTESCYKYNRQDFQLMVHYCDPKNKSDPLFSVISPCLKVFARKPSTPISTLTKKYKPNKKRKRKSDSSKKKSQRTKLSDDDDGDWIDDEEYQPPPDIEQSDSVQASNQNLSPPIMDQFSSKLNHLVRLTNQLNDTQRSRIQTYVTSRLLREDAGQKSNNDCKQETSPFGSSLICGD